MAVASEFLTFLFTDIEGSSALWEGHPIAMEQVVARHDELLRAAVDACGGRVIKTTGDGVHAVFRSPRDGVRAALDGQRAIIDEEWPNEMSLRVRMGVHAGEATEREGDWFGTEVNRAARVMSVAHGGQVVCTGIVQELVREDFDLVDLGEHRLRDLQSTVHLFQVEVPGAPAVHPPLRSVDAQVTNLPYELSSFIGRERELADIEARMQESRLVTIVGVGGVGKTRIALQVGAAVLPGHPDGVWLCELAPVDDPGDLHDAIAAALRFTPSPAVPIRIALQQHLERKQLLLVLDNCEHLVGAVAAFVSETASHAPEISVLATSREALGVRGEHIFPLPSLTLPPSGESDAVLASEAGALFASRAREASGELAIDERNATAIQALCTRLDGIPLAIELAAAQTTLMTPVEIEKRLDRQFKAATGGRRGAMERHQTLRAAIDWSYQLLSPGAQALLQRLSVCVGGFDLDAADAMASGIHVDAFELLRELVAKSLVERYEANANTRYRLLEMIRQYAAEQLDVSGDVDMARDLHAAHHARRLVQIARDVTSDDEYAALDLLGIETPNIAAGLEWWLATDRAAEVLQAFGDMPFFDGFAAPPVFLDELTPIARTAIDSPGAERVPGFAEACMVACFLAFLRGDIDDYAVLTTRASSIECVAGEVCSSCLSMFHGEMDRAVEHAAHAADLARVGEPQLHAWTLAHRAVMESYVPVKPGSIEPSAVVDLRSHAETHSDEALRVGRNVPGTIAQQYPLLAVAACAMAEGGAFTWNRTGPEVARGVAAAEEVAAIDRTQRRFWSTTVGSTVANALAARGAAGPELVQ